MKEVEKFMTKGGTFLGTTLHNKSVVENIIDRIISAIVEGELKPGDQLPTEMEFCRDLGVGRNSVREAIKKLEAYGVVYIKRAEGTFVSEAYNQRMLDPMLYGLILQKKNWDDLIALRSVIDIGVMFAVMNKEKSDDLIKQLGSIIERLEKAVKKETPIVEEILEIDTEFHMAIARAAENEPITNIADYITRITLPSRGRTVQKILEGSGDRDNFVDLHRQLVHVIETKDYGRVNKVIMNHYVYWKESKK
ncbi:MAG: FadR/GntR family transcriptional regulator [Lachnospiraceae bacterium]|jgi:GntR family transcriptional repressor for pyruvate dehydrogenase complex